MNARELARWLAVAMAEWELDVAVSQFPSAQEHVSECSRAGVRASDPTSWSREYLQRLRQDRELRIARRASGGVDQHVDPATPAPSDGREEGAGGLAPPTRRQEQVNAGDGPSVAPASSASRPGRHEASKPENARG
jgi:hypothetical protein